jgi:hypothetical protein
MVVCAVICEPVSTSNSLLTGKLTGNFAISTVFEAILQPKVSVPQRFLAEFPTKINRENFAGIRDRNGDIRVIYWHIRAKAGAISDRQITQATRISWCADSPSLKKQML